ncbi:MAG TPA: cell division protein SepF [Lachnospiraceae bacterium]|nr:cell division protein SepF [Lachnospiraceae bacterium]
MGIFDKFLNAVKLNDDYDDDDEFFDEEDDIQEEAKPRKRFFKKLDDDDDFDDDLTSKKTTANRTVKEPVKAAASTRSKSAARPRNSSKITPMTGRSSVPNMEVCGIKPKGMDDTQEIADTLLAGCTVFLNLEGLDVDMAQRVFDFCCGACYAVGGTLQKASNYIFIMAPANVDISGDFQQVMDNGTEMPAARMSY